MFKNIIFAFAFPLLLAMPAHAEKLKCGENISANDVIAIDYASDGTPVEYKRNENDIQKLLVALNEKIANDSSITQSPQWSERMLSKQYWATERCGGTKNCSGKECPGGGSCVYSNVGMAGCRCE